MIVQNLYGVIWLVLGAGWGYWSYRQLSRRYARRAVGRFAANWALMTGWFAGLGGLFVNWNRGRGGGGWSRGAYVPPYQWQWEGALALALIGGLVAGALLTWLRRSDSYAFDIHSSAPFVDDEELQEILEAETRASPDECRCLAETLLAEARLRKQPLSRALESFVRRHLPGRLTNR